MFFHCRLQQLICTGESGEKAKKSKKMTKLSVIKAAISHIYTLQVGPDRCSPNIVYLSHLISSQFVIAFTYFFEPSVAEDPSGATDCTTQWNKNQNLLYCLYLSQYAMYQLKTSVSVCRRC